MAEAAGYMPPSEQGLAASTTAAAVADAEVFSDMDSSLSVQNPAAPDLRGAGGYHSTSACERHIDAIDKTCFRGKMRILHFCILYVLLSSAFIYAWRSNSTGGKKKYDDAAGTELYDECVQKEMTAIKKHDVEKMGRYSPSACLNTRKQHKQLELEAKYKLAKQYGNIAVAFRHHTVTTCNPDENFLHGDPIVQISHDPDSDDTSQHHGCTSCHIEDPNHGGSLTGPCEATGEPGDNGRSPRRGKCFGLVNGLCPVDPPTTLCSGGHYYQIVGGQMAGGASTAEFTWEQAYDDAASRCHNGHAGYLVEINSQWENDFIYSALTNHANYHYLRTPQAWLGGAAINADNVWEWAAKGHVFWRGLATTEDPPGHAEEHSINGVKQNYYENWQTNQPDKAYHKSEDCVAMNLGEQSDDTAQHGNWFDTSCYRNYPFFVVEFDG